MDTASLWLTSLSLLTGVTAIVILVIHRLQVRKAKQMALYDHFRRNVLAVVGAMDTGEAHPSLHFEVRDQFWQIERKARSGVVMAATGVVELLKPAMDSGPTDEFSGMITRALHQFDNACRTDAGLDTVPHTEIETAPMPQPQYSWDGRPDSDLQDQLDHEAALSHVFPEGASSAVESSLKDSAPHGLGYSELLWRKRKQAG